MEDYFRAAIMQMIMKHTKCTKIFCKEGL